MTPAGGWEVGLLAALSLLLGAYVGIRRPACSVKAAGAGSVLGFLGIACPVCNKVLLLLFGGELLLTYFEPVRVYVAAVAVITVLAALLRDWMAVRKVRSEEHTSELQSLMRNSYAAFCLKTTRIKDHTRALKSIVQ